MTVQLLVYYAEAPLRVEPFRRVMAHLDAAPWPVKVCEADPDEVWCLGKILNPVIAASDADIIVINAPDSLCPIPQIAEAVRLAEEAPGLVYAFTDYVRLDQNDQRGLTLHEACGHVCVAIRRGDWIEVGGYDETYIGWGPDDRDFNRRAEKLWPIRRVPGEVLHLWHGDRRPDDSPVESDPALTAASWAKFKAHA